MSNYFKVSFNCNEYFLMANLLAYSYKFSEKDSSYYLNADETERNAIDDFMKTARNYKDLHSLINYGIDFDNQPDNDSRNKLAENMAKRLEKLAEVKSDDEFEQMEGSSIKETFHTLKNSNFYKLMLGRTLEHKESLQTKFENHIQIAEETIRPILKNLDRKQIETLVLPPQLFDSPHAIKTQGEQVITLASYPEEFNEEISNLDVIAMMHEIMHTYIPVDENIKFKNIVQADVYKVINHCLVELASNGELGISLANLRDYFSTPMHQEIIRDRTTGQPIERKEYEKAGIIFAEDFEFESSTEGFKGKKIQTGKDELSNDKIRAIVYPYFLAFKNKDSKQPMQSILEDILRDKKSIINIYGEEFYNNLINQDYLRKVINIAQTPDSIIELNDTIAKDAFGIEITRNQHLSKFEESLVASDLLAVSSQTTITDFNVMSQDIRNRDITKEKSEELSK